MLAAKQINTPVTHISNPGRQDTPGQFLFNSSSSKKKINSALELNVIQFYYLGLELFDFWFKFFDFLFSFLKLSLCLLSSCELFIKLERFNQNRRVCPVMAMPEAILAEFFEQDHNWSNWWPDFFSSIFLICSPLVPQFLPPLSQRQRTTQIQLLSTGFSPQENIADFSNQTRVYIYCSKLKFIKIKPAIIMLKNMWPYGLKMPSKTRPAKKSKFWMNLTHTSIIHEHQCYCS